MQIIVAERRRGESEPNYLPDLKRDLLAVICKYVQVDPEMLSVQFEQKGDDISVLELNVTLPEGDEGTKKDETAKRVVLVTDNNTAGYPAVFFCLFPETALTSIPATTSARAVSSNGLRQPFSSSGSSDDVLNPHTLFRYWLI